MKTKRTKTSVERARATRLLITTVNHQQSLYFFYFAFILRFEKVFSTTKSAPSLKIYPPSNEFCVFSLQSINVAYFSDSVSQYFINELKCLSPGTSCMTSMAAVFLYRFRVFSQPATESRNRQIKTSIIVLNRLTRILNSSLISPAMS